MKAFLIAITIIGVFGCNNSVKNDLSQKEMELTFYIYPEDISNNSFVIEWQDTLGIDLGYKDFKLNKRPQEVWCVLTNSKQDTLGYYRGRSTPDQYCFFESTDSIVNLNFMIGANFFSEQIGSKENYIEYSKQNKLPIYFEAIQFNLKTQLRDSIKLILKNKN